MEIVVGGSNRTSHLNGYQAGVVGVGNSGVVGNVSGTGVVGKIQSPLQIPGLRLWLSAGERATVVAGNLTALGDKSGNALDVVNNGTVPYVPGSFGDKAAMTLGVGYMKNLTALIWPVGSARTLFVAMRCSTGVGGIVVQNGGGAITSRFALTSTLSVVPGLVHTDFVDATRNATIPMPTLSGIPLILESSHGGTGAMVTCKISGVSQAVTQTNPVQAESATSNFYIGDVSGTFNPNADVTCVLGYDSVLSAANASLVRDWLFADNSIGV